MVGDQYNEDDFFIWGLIDNKLFSNYKFTSNYREAFLIDSFSLFPLYLVSMLCLKLIDIIQNLN